MDVQSIVIEGKLENQSSKIKEMEEEYDKLKLKAKLEKDELQTELSRLQSTYTNLHSEYDQLKAKLEKSDIKNRRY